MASSYGTSLTAEDCAIFKALSEGQREIKAIAVHVKHIVKDSEEIAIQV
jgi:cytidine deaminase